MPNTSVNKRFLRTGNIGLDDILAGGLTPRRLYLVEGAPGAGKTTLAIQFLLEGVRNNESVLYITLSETREETMEMAASHGWDLGKVNIYEWIPSEENLKADSQYTVFHPSEVELTETTKQVLQEVERLKPSRVVFDSLSEMRLLAQNPLRFRRQILALKQYFSGRDCTVLMLDDRTDDPDNHMYSIAHGVITLDRSTQEYGVERRRMEIKKLRGRAYRSGVHDFVIRQGGLDIFPRLVASEHNREFEKQVIKSGCAPIDVLLGGGLDRGTSTLILGPAGCGKSTLALHYALEAVKRGDKVLYYAFDENHMTMRRRAEAIGLPIQQAQESRLFIHRQIDPAELTPGEFISLIRRGVDEGAKVVIIDSLNGYLSAMPQEHHLVIQLHEVLAYLSQQGVNTFMIVAQHGLLGPMTTVVDASYLADNIVVLRFFEAAGRVRKAISVLKKRSGPHEDTIREFQITSNGLQVSEPLYQMTGVLSGVPIVDRNSSNTGDLLK